MIRGVHQFIDHWVISRIRNLTLFLKIPIIKYVGQRKSGTSSSIRLDPQKGHRTHNNVLFPTFRLNLIETRGWAQETKLKEWT